MAKPRLSELVSPGGSSFWAGVKESGEPMPPETRVVGWKDALEPLPYPALLLDGEERSIGSSIALSGSEGSLRIPGICTRYELDP